MTTAAQKCQKALNILAKWRMVFAGWQLGTRNSEDAEAEAVRDHREVTMFLRAESNTMLQLLVEKKIFTIEEYQTALAENAEHLSKEYEKKFPGFKAFEHGVDMNVYIAKDTVRNWRP